MRLIANSTMFALILSGFASAANAAGPFRSCEDAARLQTRKDFASRSPGVAYERAKKSPLVRAQARIAVRVFTANLGELDDSAFRYDLKILGTRYDALNVDIGGNGGTAIFIKGTTRLASFHFYDGDLYVGKTRCQDVTMPGSDQF